mmetsp:Transcript_18974/g.18300  ORF Transcript_18974/g.18300 Transcript_18974/m.18300 type:complete len:808 (+) Transcript_18974:130-2553(+)
MWSDITALCRDATSELSNESPMINIEGFSLYDAMSAVELMDPKMDQCYNIKSSIKTEDLLKVNFPNEFKESAAVKIMKALIVQETAFLDGASSLESTHQCIFMWNGSWDSLKERTSLSDRVILAFVKSMDRSLSNVTKGVLAADIYEDEDFQTVNKVILSVDLSDIEAEEGLAIALNEVETHIEGQVDEGAKGEMRELLGLLRCRQALQSFYKACAEWTHTAIATATRAKTNASESVDRKDLLKLSVTARDSAKHTLSVLQEMTDLDSFKNEVKGFKTPGVAVVIPTSTAYAAANAASSSEAPAEEALQENDFKCYKGIEDISFAFSEIIVKVMQPTAVRAIHLKPFSESLVHIRQICTEVIEICRIYEEFCQQDGLNLDYESLLHVSSKLCNQKMHLLSRSFYLGVLYTWLPYMGDLIIVSMKARGVPVAIVSNSQVKDHWVKLGVSRVAWDTLKALTVHRNKLQFKLDGILSSWGQAVSEGTYLDRIFETANGQPELQENSESYCTYWVMLNSTYVMDLQMSLIAENELLGHSEMACFYWYWEYVLSSRSFSIDRLRKLKYLQTNNTTDKRSAHPLPPPLPEELVVKARGMLCRGLFRTFIAAQEMDLFVKWESVHTSTACMFEQRFKSFIEIPNPPCLSYADFERTVEEGKESLRAASAAGTVVDSYTQVILGNASVSFTNARRFLDEIRRQEQEFNTPVGPTGGVVKKNGKKGGKKGYGMTVSDRLACECAVDLIKFTVNSSVSTVRNQQLLKSLPSSTNTANLNNKIVDNIGNNKDIYDNIKLMLDFTKSNQFPIVGFIDKS